MRRIRLSLDTATITNTAAPRSTGGSSSRNLTPMKNSAPMSIAPMIMTVPRSPPSSTSPIAPPPTRRIGRMPRAKSPSCACFFVTMSPSQITSATLISSDGWNCTGPIASQFVLPPTVMPRGVATTSSWSAHAATSSGQASAIQNRSGIRLAMSMIGTPNRAYSALPGGLHEEAAVLEVRLHRRRREHHDEAEDHEEERRAEQQEVVLRLDAEDAAEPDAGGGDARLVSLRRSGRAGRSRHPPHLPASL